MKSWVRKIATVNCVAERNTFLIPGGVEPFPIQLRYQFAVNRDIPDWLLKIVTGGVGKLLKIVVGAPQFLFFFLLLMNVGVGPDPH